MIKRIVCLMAGLMCLMLPLQAADCSHWGGNAARQQASDETLGTALSVVWSTMAAEEPMVSSPVSADGIVVAGCNDGSLRGFAADSGDALWSHETLDAVISSPLALNGLVHVGSLDTHVYTVNLEDGGLRNSLFAEGSEYSSPILVGDRIYISSGFPRTQVISIDPASTAIVGAWETDQIVYSSPAVVDGELYCADNAGNLYRFNAAVSGEETWKFTGDGLARLSSPMVSGSMVYYVTGGDAATFYAVAREQGGWGAANWSLTLTDPVAAPAGTVNNVQYSLSSPMLSGGHAIFTYRVDYFVDTDFDFFNDSFVLREYLCAVDLTGHAIAWRIANGAVTVSNPNDIPALSLTPTPAGFQTSGGDAVAAGSSVSADFRVVESASGAVHSTVALDAPTRASACVANGMLFIGTDAGTMYGLTTDGNQAPVAAATGYDPAGGEDIAEHQPVLTWGEGADDATAAGSLTYIVRIDEDGEVLKDWIEEAVVTGSTSHALAAMLEDGTWYAWAVRVMDEDGALSVWSDKQLFSVNRGPDAPTGFVAIRRDGEIDLEWNSDGDVADYVLAWRPEGGALVSDIHLGAVDHHTVSGLTNGIPVTFYLHGIDAGGHPGAVSTATATPNPDILIGGDAYTTLEEAVAAAEEGETIDVGVGTFVLQSTLILREGVSLQGTSPRDTIIDATAAGAAFHVTPDGDGGTSLISRVTIRGASTGVRVDDHVENLTIRNVVIVEPEFGVDCGDAAVLADLVTIVGSSGAAVRSGGDMTVRNSIVTHGATGLLAASGGGIDSNFNDIAGNTTDYSGVAPGLYDMQRSVTFDEDTWIEAAGSPTIDAGDPEHDFANEPINHGGRLNMGAYGNTEFAVDSGELTVMTLALATGEVGAEFYARLLTDAGSPPIEWELLEGVLPNGLTLNTETGEISGTVANTPQAAGEYRFTVRAEDDAGARVEAELSLRIHFQLSLSLHIANRDLGNAAVNSEFRTRLFSLFGLAPFSYAVVEGDLPPGLQLDPSGELSGFLPDDVGGEYHFTIRVTDSSDQSFEQEFSMSVEDSGAAATIAAGGGGGGGGGACFIATAVYDSPIAPSVMTFRRFRDTYLLTNRPGTWFVNQYYRWSPPLAAVVARQPVLRTMAWIGLLPLLAYSTFMLQTTLLTQVLVMIGLVVGLHAWLLRRRLRVAHAAARRA